MITQLVTNEAGIQVQAVWRDKSAPLCSRVSNI